MSELPPLSAADAPRLLRASQDGDRQALGELIRRYFPSVRTYVRLRMDPALRARESASDVVQSVCEDLFSARGVAFESEAAFRGWLYAAALNKLRNRGRHHRAQKRDTGREHRDAPHAADDELQRCYASALTPSRIAMAREQVQRLEAAFDQLPEHYREVVALARVAELSHEQIATATGRTPDAVRGILARALNKLAALLDDGG